VGSVLLEGPRVVEEASAAGVHLELLALREGEDFQAAAERTVRLSRGLFRSLSQTLTPQGVMAIGRARPASLEEALAASRLAGWPLLALDGIQDPGNVGSIVRTAAAAGMPAVVVLPGTADPFGAKAIRGSAGNVFRLLVARAGWEELAGLRSLGAAAAGGRPLAEADLEGVELLVLGSEARGLSRPGLAALTIPVQAGVESLNVAAAAAVILFELRRRRAA